MGLFRRRAVTAQDVQRDYGPLVRDYEARWQTFNESVREWVLARWPESLPGGARVLDLGCGAGGFLARLAARDPRLSLTGLDVTPALLREARRAVPGAELFEDDAEKPRFAAQPFDVVCSLNLLHHLNDPAAHVAAMVRLCRPGGTIFVSTFAGAHNPMMRVVDLWLRLRNPAWRGMLSVADMRALLQRERALDIAECSVVKADAFWWLQLYRAERGDAPAAVSAAAESSNREARAR